MPPRKLLPIAFCLFSALSPHGTFANDYFIAPTGRDQASGNSPGSAWQSIERVNAAVFQPGDRILFEASGRFPGNLRVQKENGSPSNSPLLITSYGNGRATILAGSGTGISIESAGDVIISNLVVLGDGPTNNSGYGILCDNRLDEFRRLPNLRIDHVEAAGFGIFGILISGKQAGFERVRVTDCDLHHNLRGGMEVAGRLAWDSPLYAHSDVVVAHCRAHDNTGDPNYDKNHSGSGMVLYQVDRGVIEDSRAWGNGALCRHGNGGVGIWTCASRNVVIQRCESFSNRSGGGDGGGFDLDGGSIQCVLQDNFSHDNDGPGLMAYTYAYACHADKDNIIRFNISDDDARNAARYAGLWIRNDGAGMTGLQVYNNTVRAGQGRKAAAFVNGSGVEAQFHNNIFLGCGGALPLTVEQPESKLRFLNNLYWSDGAPFRLSWDSHTCSNLKDWSVASGQEASDGKMHGSVADPKFSATRSTAPIPVSDDNWRVRLAIYQPKIPAEAFPLGASSLSPAAAGCPDVLGRPVTPANWPVGALCAP